MEATRIKGLVVRDLHRSMIDMVGPEAMRAALDALPADERAEFEESLGVSWVRIAVVDRVFGELALRTDRDVVAINREVNRRAAERSVQALFRLLLKLASPEFVLSRAAAAYDRAYDRGSIEVTRSGPGRVSLALRGRPGMSALARDGFGIGIETVLKFTGVSSVRVTSTAHPEGADYSASWH
jgi:hypothetical protein